MRWIMARQQISAMSRPAAQIQQAMQAVDQRLREVSYAHESNFLLEVLCLSLRYTQYWPI